MRPTNQLFVWTVHLMPYGSEDIDHVHVLLQTVGSNGSVVTIGNARYDP